MSKELKRIEVDIEDLLSSLEQQGCYELTGLMRPIFRKKRYESIYIRPEAGAKLIYTETVDTKNG